jgi:hypothetical protein
MGKSAIRAQPATALIFQNRCRLLARPRTRSCQARWTRSYSARGIAQYQGDSGAPPQKREVKPPTRLPARRAGAPQKTRRSPEAASQKIPGQYLIRCPPYREAGPENKAKQRTYCVSRSNWFTYWNTKMNFFLVVCSQAKSIRKNFFCVPAKRALKRLGPSILLLLH